jgi:hypothetical protein
VAQSMGATCHSLVGYLVLCIKIYGSPRGSTPGPPPHVKLHKPPLTNLPPLFLVMNVDFIYLNLILYYNGKGGRAGA